MVTIVYFMLHVILNISSYLNLYVSDTYVIKYLLTTL